MYHYKVYYQYYKFASVNFRSIEYSSKTELLTGDDYNKLDEFINKLIESNEICIVSVFPLTKLSTSHTKKKEKQVEI